MEKLNGAVRAVGADEDTTRHRCAVSEESSYTCLVLLEPPETLAILDREVLAELVAELRALDTYQRAFLRRVVVAECA